MSVGKGIDQHSVGDFSLKARHDGINTPLRELMHSDSEWKGEKMRRSP